MAIAVYLRVSSKAQHVRSQRAELERYLANSGITDVSWFIDEGVSGATLDRPALAELRRAIFMGEVDTVLVYSLDRLARSAAEGIALLAEWLKRGVRLVVLNMQIDFSGDVGQMVAALLLHVAQMERTRIRERQEAGIAAAKAAGKRWGGRKLGTGKANPDRVQELRCLGLKNAEIASALGVSVRTVIRAGQTGRTRGKELFCAVPFPKQRHAR